MPWYKLVIVLHILSLVILSGGALGSIITDRAFWSNLGKNNQHAAAIARLSGTLANMAQIGSILSLVTGLGLLALSKWVYIGQVWMQIKLGLYILLFLNGSLVAKPTAAKLKALFMRLNKGEVSAADSAFAPIRSRLSTFHIVQTIGLVILVCLGVLKLPA